MNRWMTGTVSLLVALMLLLTPGVSRAEEGPKVGDLRTLMRFGELTENAPTNGYAGWIPVVGFQFGVKRDYATTLSTRGGFGINPPEVKELTIFKQVDSTSPRLMEAVVLGQSNTVNLVSLLEIEEDGEGEEEEAESEDEDEGEGEDEEEPRLVRVYQITLENAYVASVNQWLESGVLVEEVRIRFTRVTTRFWPLQPNGDPGTPVVWSYDVESEE